MVMKKNSYLIGLALTLVAAGSATILTGCEDDDYWPYNPPPGWGGNYFYDSRLEGSWELTQADYHPVGRYDTNYMEFYGGGHGTYYYYTNGYLEDEDMAYFCQEADYPNGNNLINIQYETGRPSTMNYWLSNGNTTLTFTWRTGDEIVTYVYSRIRRVP